MSSEGRLTIVCVDDEEIVLRSLKRQLRNLFGNRYRYETAQSAGEGWEILEELDEDGVQVLLIVSDWLMPVVRGDEFLVDVHQRYPQVAKALLTGQADTEAVQRAHRDAHLLATVAKPWTASDLERLVEGAVGAPSR